MLLLLLLLLHLVVVVVVVMLLHLHLLHLGLRLGLRLGVGVDVGEMRRRWRHGGRGCAGVRWWPSIRGGPLAVGRNGRRVVERRHVGGSEVSIAALLPRVSFL
jgi:hypothetical protein